MPSISTIETAPTREEMTNRFWTNQFKYQCQHQCKSCYVKKRAIEIAKKARSIDDLREKLEKPETCEIVATYTAPRWAKAIYGRYTFLIVTNRGHHEFFKVGKFNVTSLFKRQSRGAH